MEEKILIVGGGLSGLTLAYYLSKKNKKVIILEGSSRLGGRIQTIKGSLGTPLELGATWFTKSHEHLNNLIEELKLQKYLQYTKGTSFFETTFSQPLQKFQVPDLESSSFRLKGGTQKLIEKLVEFLEPNNIVLNSKVLKISEVNDEILVETRNHKSYYVHKVILCIPPPLVSSQIIFSPPFPYKVSKVFENVQTWMAGAIKFVLEYEQPFWRYTGNSGMFFSHVGIVMEIHDHVNYEQTRVASITPKRLFVF